MGAASNRTAPHVLCGGRHRSASSSLIRRHRWPFVRLMPRGRGRGNGGAVASTGVQDYFLRSTRQVHAMEGAVGGDADTVDATSRLDNVERNITQLTTQMGQLLAVMQAAHQPSTSPTTASTDAFATPHRRPTDEDAPRGVGIAGLVGGRGRSLLSALRSSGYAGGPVDFDGRPGRRDRRPIDTSKMDKLHGDVSVATLKLWVNRWNDFFHLN